jgi:signal transduction histidine kinase
MDEQSRARVERRLGIAEADRAGAAPGAGSLADEASFVLGMAALLGISWSLLHQQSWIPGVGVASPLAELADFAALAIAGFFSVAPGIALLVVLERLLPAARARRWPALFAGVLFAAALATGLWSGFWSWVVLPQGDLRAVDWKILGLSYSGQLAWLALLAVWREALWQRGATLAALHESELRSVALQARVAEAELQMLQAQIEPHFLFNSLANLRRLGRLDAAAGKAMLADLLQYLRQTLPRLREADSTLGREAEVARAYLAVHKIRMGERLEVEFAIPAELEATPLPPMMLLTLTENALKHGLAPLPEGGRIRIAAERDGDAVRLSVADTGRGIVPGRGSGTGLENLRARLRTLHGAKAELGLRTNLPRGVVASIVVPRA